MSWCCVVACVVTQNNLYVNMSLRSYVFTLFLHSEFKEDEFRERVEALPGMRYAIWQHEESKSGRGHLQGYMEFKRTYRVRGLKLLLREPRIHLEKRRGTRDQAREYCRKEESWISGTRRTELGQWIGGGQGTRTDIQLLVDGIKNGETDTQLVEHVPSLYLRYGSGINRLRSLFSKKRCSPVKTKVYWGKTGTGKSRRAWYEFPNAYSWRGTKWWDGYSGEDCVICDDPVFKLPIQYWLTLLDRYSLNLEIKGGMIKRTFSKMIITSNVPPYEWFPNASASHMAALFRRIEVIEFTSEWLPPSRDNVCIMLDDNVIVLD